MSALSVAGLRQRIASTIDTALAASGWRQSSDTWEQFGTGGDGEGRMHLGYAIGCPASAVMGNLQRQRLTEGALVETELHVRWGFNLAALDQVNAYDDALAAEAALVVAIMSVSRSANLNLVLERAERRVDDQGWVLGDVKLRAFHQYALA